MVVLGNDVVEEGDEQGCKFLLSDLSIQAYYCNECGLSIYTYYIAMNNYIKLPFEASTVTTEPHIAFRLCDEWGLVVLSVYTVKSLC